LSSDKIKARRLKDDIEEEMGSDQLKADISVADGESR
jgi:hypothetical protein